MITIHFCQPSEQKIEPHVIADDGKGKNVEDAIFEAAQLRGLNTSSIHLCGLRIHASDLWLAPSQKIADLDDKVRSCNFMKG